MTTFKKAIRSRDFVVTSECFLKPETDARALRAQADVLRGSVDGVLLTDNQYGGLHMSTVAAAKLMIDNGIDPIVQLSCRNRNRLSLIADILGGAALGATSFLLVRGNRVPQGIVPRPKAVLDVNASELIQIATNLHTDENMKQLPELFVGGTITPHEPKADWKAAKVKAKVEAGALFMLTYICMDLELLKRYMARLVAERITRRMSVLVSTCIVTSADDARFLQQNRPNMLIPDAVIDRLEKAADPRIEGFTICAEQLNELQKIPGVSGANIIASTDLTLVPQVVAAAGITR